MNATVVKKEARTRRYIRHPSDIPIEFMVDENANPQMERLSNISLGGLAFNARTRIEPGRILKIRVPFVNPPFEAHGKVVWCDWQEEGAHYEVGVELLDRQDAYRARMIEQVCHIEHYKREVHEHEGRMLSGQQAAKEWIEKYAADFPQIGEVESR